MSTSHIIAGLQEEVKALKTSNKGLVEALERISSSKWLIPDPIKEQMKMIAQQALEQFRGGVE